jgi:hypothetical protein
MQPVCPMYQTVTAMTSQPGLSAQYNLLLFLLRLLQKETREFY